MAELARALATRVACRGRVAPPEPRNETETEPHESELEPLHLLLTAAWFGMITGLLELGGLVAAREIIGKITYDTLRTNWHYAWMIPVSNLALFGTAGIVLSLLARVLPRASITRIAIF